MIIFTLCVILLKWSNQELLDEGWHVECKKYTRNTTQQNKVPGP